MTRVIGAALVAIWVAFSAPVPLRAQSLMEAVDLYLAGSFDEAVQLACRLRGNLQGDVIRSSTRPFDGRRVRAGLALHTEVMFHGAYPPFFCGDREAELERPRRVARPALISLVEDSRLGTPEWTFLTAWYRVVIAFNLGQGQLARARVCVDTAPARVLEDPEIQLAVGSLNEISWRLLNEDGVAAPGMKGDLAVAERAYHQAVTGKHDLLEAQLRLARVLVEQRKIGEAVRLLSPLQTAIDADLAYLANLFVGQIDENSGNPSAARQSFLAALALRPSAQSARVALAHLNHTLGDRKGAAADVLELAAAVGRDADIDPWLWYEKGTARLADRYLAELRQAAVQQ